MKTIAALLATICVAASFAEAQGGVHPIKIDPSQCGFYAGLSFTTPNGVLSHCKVVATLIRGQGAPCANLANGWTVPADMRGAAANHCQKLGTDSATLRAEVP
ncbi:hypothetical protein BGZ74_001107 [Mortierella antarctica]|nr:hypothetical protein BGZ74_001107 [Mortierella antarctica]